MTVISSIVGRNAQEIYRDRCLQTFDGDESGNVILAHYGEFSHSKVDQLLKFIETTVLLNGTKRRVMKRICSVLIECLQNVANHGARDQSGSQQSFVVLGQTGEEYEITTGNLILQEDAALVANRLESLNKLDQNEIRKLYIETLCNENFSFKGGAGLGFLTIAKKTKREIDFAIHEVDSGFAYLTMAVRVKDAE